MSVKEVSPEVRDLVVEAIRQKRRANIALAEVERLQIELGNLRIATGWQGPIPEHVHEWRWSVAKLDYDCACGETAPHG